MNLSFTEVKRERKKENDNQITSDLCFIFALNSRGNLLLLN